MKKILEYLSAPVVAFRSFSVRLKLFIVFGMSAFFIGGIILVGVVNTIWVKDTSSAAYKNELLETREILELDRDIETSRRILLEMLGERDRDRRDSDLKALKEASRTVDENVRLLGDSERDGNVRAEVLKLKGIWEDFKRTREEEIIPAIFEGRTAYAAGIAKGIQASRFNSFNAIADGLVARNYSDTALIERRIEKRISNSIVLYAVIALCGFIAGNVVVVWLAGNISKRLKTITDAFERVKEGDLDFKIHMDGMDEIGVMACDFNEMVKRLHDDKLSQEQALQMMRWYSDDNGKKFNELERLNLALTTAQEELDRKNMSLEKRIQEITTINQRLVDAKEQLIRSEKMASIGQLAAGVAHEINTPIAFVRSNFQTLSEYVDEFMETFRRNIEIHGAIREGCMERALELLREVDERQKQADMEFMFKDIGHLVGESKDGIDRVISIVKGLKDFSHSVDAQMVEYDINKCLEDTLRLCWHEIKYKAEVERDFGDIPAVPCQPQRLSQVFMNIIVNAVHAIPQKGKITVKTYTVGDYVLIKITDTGTGMPETVLQKIFDPFFTTKPVGIGTGLGLPIAYRIIQDHNGSIDAESRVGEGSTFTIRLPAAKEINLCKTQSFL